MSDSENVNKPVADVVPPVPATAAEVRAWIGALADRVAAGEVGAAHLTGLLGRVRAAGAAHDQAADYLLLAARDAGASLRQIAPVMGRGYVRTPAARLEKLDRRWSTAVDFAAAITSGSPEPTPQPE